MEIEFVAGNVEWNEDDETIFIDPDDLICSEDEYELVEESVLLSEALIGPLIVCVQSS